MNENESVDLKVLKRPCYMSGIYIDLEFVGKRQLMMEICNDDVAMDLLVKIAG